MMTRYLVLLRGINVGGRNKVPMAALRDLLESHGHTKVSTYIASGNVILSSDRSAAAIKRELEDALPTTFKLDSELIAVLVLTQAQLRAIVRKRPKGFGDHPDTYHSDAVFLMGIDASAAMKVFNPRPGVDEVWPGTGVIYSQRLSAQRTKSRLGKIVGTPAYKSMTIRSWQTTMALLERMEAPDAEAVVPKERKPTARAAAEAGVLATLPAAMTGRASPAKAAVGDKPVFAYISSLPQPQRSIAEAIDALAARTLPALQRSVKWGMAWYGVGDGWCFSCGGFAGHVKLTFGRGTSLTPVPPVTPIGMGKDSRGVDLQSLDGIDERQLAAWMEQAAAIPGFGKR